MIRSSFNGFGFMTVEVCHTGVVYIWRLCDRLNVPIFHCKNDRDPEAQTL